MNKTAGRVSAPDTSPPGKEMGWAAKRRRWNERRRGGGGMSGEEEEVE
jgi:hypothetical protein